MSSEPLTRDNPLLSGPSIGARAASDQDIALNCKSPAVDDFLRHSLADRTQTAYLSDIKQFEHWGGSIPANPEQIANYLADEAKRLSVATLVRRMASLSKAHEARGVPSPTKTELVRATMRGIRRSLGCPQTTAAPLLRDDLFRILDATGDTPKDTRDRALLLIGFAGGFRRSELVAIDREDVSIERAGMCVTVRRSKTDQFGLGRKVAIPFGRTRWCPVIATERWLLCAGIKSGPLFLRIDRHARIFPSRLSPEAVSLVVKGRAVVAGIDPTRLSGHSLRAGLATSAAQAGCSASKIRAQTGHTSDAMLARYIRDGELFTGNAAGALL